MKISSASIVASAVAGFAGCASTPPLALAPVGPRQYPAEASSAAPRGTLVVYSAFDPTSALTDDRSHHSDYELRSADGQLIQRVRNRANGISEEPAALDLAPGRYEVAAPAVNSRRVVAPVMIEADKTTCLRLDGSEPVGSKRVAANELVRLPDGTVVGWRVKNDR